MKATTLLTLLPFLSAVNAAYKPPVVLHDGEPMGSEEEFENVTIYTTLPTSKSCSPPKIGVLYLTDVFGLPLEKNLLLADSFALAGFPTVAPDLFGGEPAPVDLDTPGFDLAAFLAAHGTEQVDPLVAAGVKYLKEVVGVEKVATAGYCFGGKYAFRFLADGMGGDVGFAAHPSNLLDGEVEGVVGAVSVAAAETDALLTPERRVEIEALVQATGVEYEISLFGGTGHGFGVRADVEDPKQKFAKETAFLQAINFFTAWA